MKRKLIWRWMLRYKRGSLSTIYPIPAFQDNYIWVLVNDTKQAIVVDPGEASSVLEFLHHSQFMLDAILLTHKHYDHTAGVAALLEAFPEASVFSSEQDKIPQTTQIVSDNEIVSINKYEFKIIAIPGHTLGHIAYYCKPFLFCGDTLFANGCGRIFEGTPEQMLHSLKKLMVLPDETKIYCGHEYTLANINFALRVELDNTVLKKRFEDTKQLRVNHQPTLPSTLQLEKLTNPFLRCHESSVVEAVSKYTGKKLDSEVEVFVRLREWKNNT